MDKLIKQNAPHVRQRESLFTVMLDVVIALLPLYVMCFFYYGGRALALGFVGVFSSVIFTFITDLFSRRKPNLRDLTPVITGLIIPLLMPADIPYYAVFCATAVAIFVVKFPFGGTGNNLFNPAAVGFAAVAICWQEMVFKYPALMQNINIFGENSVKQVRSISYSLAMGAVPDFNILDLLVGNVPGPMGTVNIIVVIASGIFLIVKKAVNWRTPFYFLLTYGLLTYAFPRITAEPLQSVCYEIFGGMSFFGAFFLLSEPVTSPKRDLSKILYSVVSGIVVFLFRYFGGLEDGFVYALIVMNVFAPIFDVFAENIVRKLRHRNKANALKNEKKPESNINIIRLDKDKEEVML